ncbi:MAG: sporulation protein YqfD [Oscillospiraceae bacterium]
MADGAAERYVCARGRAGTARQELRCSTEKLADQHVIASRAGVLTRVEAVAGNCLCAPGQAVAGGELLVSAYTDFGFKTQVTAARAEIYAETVRQAVCVLPEAERSRRTARLRAMRSVCLSDGGAFRFSARTYRKDFAKKRQKRGF